MKAPLQAVHNENYAIRRDVIARAERIDKLSVDRSRFASVPLARWSAEAEEAGELSLQAERAALTEADRWQARKALFATTAGPLHLVRSKRA